MSSRFQHVTSDVPQDYFGFGGWLGSVEAVNQMAEQASTFLRSAATQPVDWKPWSESVFADAQTRGLPVLLVIGYPLSMWCEQMATDVFSDPEVARQLNESFVCVLVDRDERPDIDSIYNGVLSVTTGRSGWPLIAALDHQQRPFWVGGFLDRDKFVEVLDALTRAWNETPEQLPVQARRFLEALDTNQPKSSASEVAALEQLNTPLSRIASAADAEWGGFGTAPKFLNPAQLTSMLGVAASVGSDVARQILETSLDAISAGGVYDQIGGGFFQFSTDREWLVPRFDKTLSDQAQMALLYSDAFTLTGRPLYRRVTEETLTFVLSTMRLDEGGFAQATGALSIGPGGVVSDGVYYTWTPEEIQGIFANAHIDERPVDIESVLEWFDITPEGHLNGRSIPNRRNHRDDQLRTPEIAAVRNAMAEIRAKRPSPPINTTALTEPNAWMVFALARCGARFGRSEWSDAAVEGGEFLLSRLRDSSGGWLRSWHPDAGAAETRAAAADYGPTILALLELAQITGRHHWLDAAIETADELLDNYFDPVEGGIWNTGEYDDGLAVRQKILDDRLLPSPNATAANGLIRLAAITGELRYHTHAERILQYASAALDGIGATMPTMMSTIELFHRSVTTVALVDLANSGEARVGDPDGHEPTDEPTDEPADEIGRMFQLTRLLPRPDLLVLSDELLDTPLGAEVDGPGAWVFRNGERTGPFATMEELFARLTGKAIPSPTGEPEAGEPEAGEPESGDSAV